MKPSTPPLPPPGALANLDLRRPGLFITGTDTGVGKTVATCAIAWALRRQGVGSVGVCKPFSSGCRRDREGLVSEDAEALAHFADCRHPLHIINPIRFAAPLAPAVAAAQAWTHREHEQASDTPIDWPALRRSLEQLDATSDVLLIEGIGGLMVPLDPLQPRYTLLDLAAAIGYPVLVVARSTLGTLNHAAMTIRLLQGARCRVAGIVMNGFDADVAQAQDASVSTNRQWLERLTGVKVIAVLPRVAPDQVAPHQARIAPDILDAAAMVHWPQVVEPARG